MHRYTLVSGQSLVPFIVKKNIAIVTVLKWMVDNKWLSEACVHPKMLH